MHTGPSKADREACIDGVCLEELLEQELIWYPDADTVAVT